MRKGLFALVPVVVASVAADARAAPDDDVYSGAYATPEPSPPPTPAPPKAYAVELAGQAGYLSPPVRGAASPFGAGFGGHVGLDIQGVYVGARVLHFLGGSDVDVSYQSLMLGLELGYGFRFKSFGGTKLILRPFAGVGDVGVSYTDPTLAKPDVVTSASGSSSASNTITVHNVYVEPSLAAMLVSDTFFFALEASTMFIPGITPYNGGEATTWVSYGGQGLLGFRL